MRRHPRDRHPASGRDARGLSRRRRRAQGPDRRPGVRRGRRPARAGPAPATRRARRLREPAAGARRRGRPPDRARARRRPLLRGQGVRDDGTVFDTCEYHPSQVERIARRGFELARPRRQLTSVDKANVLETSRIWRRGPPEIAADYPDVSARGHARGQRGDAARADPEQFDVIVTENMFGDILSDLAAASTGGLGSRRRRASPTTGPASSSRFTAPRPTSPAGGSRTPRRCSSPPRCCSSTGSAAPRGSRARRRRSAGTRADPDAGPRRTGVDRELGDAVLDALAEVRI